MAEHAIVMHPGPMNRGMEITAEVADRARSAIVEQVTNGVAVRMAVLYLLLAATNRQSPTRVPRRTKSVSSITDSRRDRPLGGEGPATS